METEQEKNYDKRKASSKGQSGAKPKSNILKQNEQNKRKANKTSFSYLLPWQSDFSMEFNFFKQV